MTMVNNVIEVVNYVIAARPSLLNFMIADTGPYTCVEIQRSCHFPTGRWLRRDWPRVIFRSLVRALRVSANRRTRVAAPVANAFTRADRLDELVLSEPGLAVGYASERGFLSVI